MFRHVVLLRRDPSLGLALRALLHGTGRVTELPTIEAWSALPAEDIDAVVIDLPVPRRKQAINLVRSSFTGRLVLVLEPNDDPAAVPPDPACSVVQRPFEIVELWHLVTTDPTPTTSAPDQGPTAPTETRPAGPERPTRPPPPPPPPPPPAPGAPPPRRGPPPPPQGPLPARPRRAVTPRSRRALRRRGR